MLTRAQIVMIPDRSWRTNVGEARDIITEFHLMMPRRFQERAHDTWIERACISLVASLVSGVVNGRLGPRSPRLGPTLDVGAE
ncbi:hypothetical protein BSZ21_00750 [Bradyrhizobium canariense]|nr:hypothetical protein BSZ21_00750 [Bradyrhizobium canariense]